MIKKPQSDQQTFQNRTLRSRKEPSEPNSLKRRNSSSLPDDANKKQRRESVDSSATPQKEQTAVDEPPELPPPRRSNRRHSQFVPTFPSGLQSLRNQRERDEKPVDAKPQECQSPGIQPTRRSCQHQLSQFTLSKSQGRQSNDNGKIAASQTVEHQPVEHQPKRRSFRRAIRKNNRKRKQECEPVEVLAAQQPTNRTGGYLNLSNNRKIAAFPTVDSKPAEVQPIRRSSRRSSQFKATSFSEPQGLQNVEPRNYRRESDDLLAGQQSGNSPGLSENITEIVVFQSPGFQSAGFQSPGIQNPTNRADRRQCQYTPMSPSETPDFQNDDNRKQGPESIDFSTAQQPWNNDGLKSPGLQSPSRPYRRSSQYKPMSIQTDEHGQHRREPIDYLTCQQPGNSPVPLLQSPGVQPIRHENRKQRRESLNFSANLQPVSNAESIGFQSPVFQLPGFQSQGVQSPINHSADLPSPEVQSFDLPPLNRPIPLLQSPGAQPIRHPSQYMAMPLLETQGFQHDENRKQRRESVDFSADVQPLNNTSFQPLGLQLLELQSQRVHSPLLPLPGLPSPVLQSPGLLSINRPHLRLSQYTPMTIQTEKPEQHPRESIDYSPPGNSPVSLLQSPGAQPIRHQYHRLSQYMTMLSHESQGFHNDEIRKQKRESVGFSANLQPVSNDGFKFSGFQSPGLHSPGLSSPGLSSPGLSSPGLSSPGLSSPGLPSPEVQLPDLPLTNSPHRRPSQYTPMPIQTDKPQQQRRESIDCSTCPLTGNSPIPGLQSPVAQPIRHPHCRPSQYMAMQPSESQGYQNDENREQRRESVDLLTTLQPMCTASFQHPGYQLPGFQTQEVQSPGIPLRQSPELHSPGVPSPGAQSPGLPPPSRPCGRPSQFSPTPSDAQSFQNDDYQKLTRESVDLPANHLQRNKIGPQSELQPTRERSQSDDSRKRESIDCTAALQPGNTVSTHTSGRSEMGSQFLLYIRNLGTEIVHHEIFEYFCLFGDLKRVCVLQRTETYKFAMILYTTEKSLKRALGANPHNLRGRQYFCHVARSWHLGCFRTDWQLSDAHNRSIFRDRFQIKVPYGVNVHCYVYQTSASLTQGQSNTEQSAASKGKRLALLPQSSMTLLSYLRSEQSPSQPPVEQTQPDLYPQTLFAAMGKNYNFVRHSYTNFLAHKKLPGQYETVPIASKIGLTAIAYADLRDKPDLITFFYQNA